MGLSGLLGTSESMFPNIAKSFTPTPSDIDDEYRNMQLDRNVSMTGYRVEIFDMHNAKDRRKYERLMVDLSTRSRPDAVRVTAHERRLLPRKDGSTGWFNYVEWVEFKLEERPIATTSSEE